MSRFFVDGRPGRARIKVPRPDWRRAAALAKSAWDEGERLAAFGDAPGALRWMGRAHRIAPSDQNILFALAFAHWRAGDAVGAASLFGQLWERHRTRESASGLLASLMAQDKRAEALAVLETVLRETALDGALAQLAGRITPRWCGLEEDGALRAAGVSGAVVARDGRRILPLQPLGPGRFTVPAPANGLLAVADGDGAMTGSPLDVGRIFRLEGFAERRGRFVSGWAWYPGAPGRDPVLELAAPDGALIAHRIVTRIKASVTGSAPLARPREFRIAAPRDLAVHVRDTRGQAVLGSPVAAAEVAPRRAARRTRAIATPSAMVKLARLAVDVIIPVYRGREVTLACLDSVLGTVPRRTRIWVVDDASPDAALLAALRKQARAGLIRLIPSGPEGANLGFPAAVNAGLRAAAGRHAVLLNSDTLVAPGWLQALRGAALSGADIGTATPLSNDASILSYPDPAGRNAVPGPAAVRRIAALASAANRGCLVDLPTAHGFCMFIRADCLAAAGEFETELFAQGYGEENDFCERARALGFRHVAVPEVFVGHVGGQSFGPARVTLLRRNLGLLARRHPDYLGRVSAWIAADPLSAARFALDRARFVADGAAFAASSPHHAPRAVLLVSHGGGGGTRRFVRARAASIEAAGERAIILGATGRVCTVDGLGEAYPNLRFALPAEAAELGALLQAAGVARAELHHLMGHDRAVLDLLRRLGVGFDVFVHDYGWFCHRLSFVTGEGRFCGEAAAAQCATCIRDWGSAIGERISPASLRRRSSTEFAEADRVLVASDDVARRVRRFVPGCAPEVVAWEAPVHAARPLAQPTRPGRRIAVIGAIGLDKGFDVLLACALDAASRRLPLDFVVIGYTVDDLALLSTGKVFVTGEFAAGEAAALIRAQAADLAFIPSIWPETWCYALSDAWAAGLPAAVFEIGTPPLRVRAARRGWVLPLGLPAPRVNDALLSL